MKPKLSNKSQYKFSLAQKHALYVFLKEDKDDKIIKPFIVMEDKNKHARGFITELIDDGIVINKMFFIPKEDIKGIPTTKDINEGICVWLELTENKEFIIE